MMATKTAAPAALVVLLMAAAAGCSDPDAPPPNPEKVWLCLNGSERAVKLCTAEPNPF